MPGRPRAFAILAAVGSLACADGAEPSKPASADPAPVVVELFTSEGCSSCPPADDLLAELARSRGDGVTIVPLSFHVDYWDSLGWRDPWSSSAWSDRQRSYAARAGSARIYTPQMVVDGRTEFVGSNKARADAAIAQAATVQKLVVDFARIAETEPGKLAAEIRIADGEVPDDAVVWLAITEDDLTSTVPRGENAGRTLHHAGVVRSVAGMRIERKDGQTSAVGPVALPAGIRRKSAHVVVLVENGNAGGILGAASMPLGE